MSISSLGGGQSTASLRTSFQPPSFASLDSNSDDSLTLDELRSGAPKGASDKKTEALFNAMDADSDGSVTSSEKDIFDSKMEEQRQGMAFMVQQLSSTAKAEIFAATDTDGDGAVTLAEFSADEEATAVDDATLKKIVDLIDADASGSISETESSQFIDAIETAMNERRSAGGPPPNGGPPPSGGPSAEAAAEEDDGVTTLFSIAQSAYQNTQQQTLLDQLSALFDSAA